VVCCKGRWRVVRDLEALSVPCPEIGGQGGRRRAELVNVTMPCSNRGGTQNRDRPACGKNRAAGRAPGRRDASDSLRSNREATRNRYRPAYGKNRATSRAPHRCGASGGSQCSNRGGAQNRYRPAYGKNRAASRHQFPTFGGAPWRSPRSTRFVGRVRVSSDALARNTNSPANGIDCCLHCARCCSPELYIRSLARRPGHAARPIAG
jgi:hypothetical protein